MCLRACFKNIHRFHVYLIFTLLLFCRFSTTTCPVTVNLLLCVPCLFEDAKYLEYRKHFRYLLYYCSKVL